ncbi:hypothetical protein HanRHA438_Chr05g0216501 [Helianthus annuus]|nr:hypothetical protein HanHA300_Chr05g0169731 [Helianthus annuus]KAJ0584042.1 hypothetical protein HanHA89_Chr05g0183871 [Helianthus annuus]KAJ0749708.1 hypothetical protein HanLR1_Chr05g0173251 [Helianthus annuus]KAJ0918318.1 hypothetical protein HanRHA438_Chr05g0216501 [Helianthus annuus]
MFPHPFTIYYSNPMILFLTTFFANSGLEELLSTNDTLGAMGHEYHRYGGITRTIFRTRFDRDRLPVTTFEFSQSGHSNLAYRLSSLELTSWPRVYLGTRRPNDAQVSSVV